MYLSTSVLTNERRKELGTVVVMRDITELKRAQELTARLASFPEQNPGPVVEVDLEGKVTYQNPRAKMLLPELETQGTAHPFLGEFNDLKELVRESGSANRQVQVEETWYEQFVHSVPSVKTMRFYARDITEQKFGESERRKLEEQLQQSQRMEAIGMLAGGVAHDFNNILASIIGFTEMAIEDSAEGTPVHGNVKEVLRAANRAKDLVEQILTFSRMGGQKKVPVIVQNVVEVVLRLMKPSVPKSVEVVTEMPEEPLTVISHSTHLHQVVLNICTNGYQAMREKGGGKLSLRVECIDAEKIDGEAGLLLEPCEYARISISDTGSGMTPEVKARLFEPFFTTKKPGEGTGLGLAASNRMIRHLHGMIHVESEEGKGSTFQVYLPIASPEMMVEAEAAAAEESGAEIVYGEGRILFVDDEETITRMAKQMLERLGYSVTAVSNPLDALDLFKRDPAAFDLVITDQTMPRLTGDALGSAILAVRANMPLIVCSGYTEKFTPEQAKRIGFREYIKKPLSFRDLSRRVSSVLKEAKLEARVAGLEKNA